MRMHIKLSRTRGALAALLPLALGACDELLDVENPAVIAEDQLKDREMVEVMARGIEAQFQQTFGAMALYTGMFSDELIDGHVYLPHDPWDRRDISPDHEFVGSMYSTVHALRGVADTLGVRMEAVLGEEASSSLPMAKARVYAGYAFVMLGEDFCESPINGSAPLSPTELLGMGIERFDAAISIAQAVVQGGGADAAEAGQILNLARVGAARAAFGSGDHAAAASYAQAVLDANPAFEFWAAYSDNSGPQENDFYATTPTYDPEVTGSRWMGAGTAFEGLNDLRIPHSDSTIVLMDTRDFYILYQPYSFSGWESGVPVELARDADIRFASALEARYILQEINGPTLSFLNERRAVGGQPALTAMPADPPAELRDQRRRDLYMTGHRLGDLRRYIERYGLDLFPTGHYPQTELGEYGDATCIPISRAELDNNPNIP